MKICLKSKSLLLSISFILLSCASTSHQVTRNLVEGNNAAMNADYKLAEENYKKALKLNSYNFTTIRNLGIVQVKLAKYDEALKNLLTILSKYKQDAEVYYFLGEASRGLEDYVAAEKYYTLGINVDPNDLRLIKALSWSLFKSGKYDKSITTISPWYKKNPKDIQILLIATSNLNKLKRYNKIISLLSVLEQNNFNLYSKDQITADSERALLISVLADSYYNLNNCEKAENLYTEVLKSRPFLTTALTGSAKCDINDKNYNKALVKLDKAIKANPDSIEPYYLLGKIWENIDFNKSMYYYRKFLILSKNDKNYTLEMKLALSTLNKLEKNNNNSTNNNLNKNNDGTNNNLNTNNNGSGDNSNNRENNNNAATRSLR